MVEKLVRNGVKLALDLSYWACLFSALGGNIAYMIGFKKGIKVTVGAIVIYVFIAALT